MTDIHKRRRINYSIKRGMQTRLFLKVFSISTVSVGIMGVIFYFYSNRQIYKSYRQFHQNADNFLDFLLPAILLSLLASLLVSALATLFFPHKIAGPLFRIERDLKEKIGEGDLTVRFKLRHGDELSDLAGALNLSLENLRLRIEAIKQSAEALKTAASGKKDIAEIEKLVAALNEGFQKFKL